MNKKIKKSTQTNFCDDALSNIFLLFPVDILFNTLRLVCTQWKQLIENPLFIRQHFLNSEPILFKEINYDFGHSMYIYSRCNIRNEIQNNRTKHVVIETNNHLEFPGRVISSIDGFLVFTDRRDLLYVLNPVTKEVVKLPRPPLISLTRGSKVMIVPVFSAAEYKLVSCALDSCALYVHTTTIGKQDELWRRVDHNYPNDKGGKIPEQFEVPAIPVEGFLFWAKHDCSNIITLNMKTEKFVEFAAPDIDLKKDKVWYIKMKNKLSCIHRKDPCTLVVYLVEESKKPGIFQWSKIYEIDWRWGYFVPFAWDGKGEVLLLICMCYTTEPNSEIVALNMVSKSSSCISFSGVSTPGYSW